MSRTFGKLGTRWFVEFKSPSEIKAEEEAAELELALQDRCPACGHTREQREWGGFEEAFLRRYRRRKGLPTLAARCGSSAEGLGDAACCRCREPFHGS